MSRWSNRIPDLNIAWPRITGPDEPTTEVAFDPETKAVVPPCSALSDAPRGEELGSPDPLVLKNLPSEASGLLDELAAVDEPATEAEAAMLRLIEQHLGLYRLPFEGEAAEPPRQKKGKS